VSRQALGASPVAEVARPWANVVETLNSCKSSYNERLLRALDQLLHSRLGASRFVAMNDVLLPGAIELLRCRLHLGFRFADVARSYGFTDSAERGPESRFYSFVTDASHFRLAKSFSGTVAVWHGLSGEACRS
jgi:hypothetical protein